MLQKIFYGLLVCTMAMQTHSTDEKNSPIVIELYTSQGCHSCPPADYLLGELKKRKNIIALACHVTYWNYLGWHDTFSKSFCDQRQRDYQQHLQGRAGVYTPQMIINGRAGVLGSSPSRVTDELHKTPAIQAIQLSFQSDKILTIDLPKLDHNKSQKLWLMGTSGDHRLPIKRGENGGKTLSYHNPVAVVIELDNWRGERKTIQANIDDSSVKEWVVLAQDYPNGSLRAAGKLALN